MACKKNIYTLFLHRLHNYWFCYNFNKKNHPQVYLEECKYRIKKTEVPKFIKNELKSDSELDSVSDSDSESDELMAKLIHDCDSDLDLEVESKH